LQNFECVIDRLKAAFVGRGQGDFQAEPRGADVKCERWGPTVPLIRQRAEQPCDGTSDVMQMVHGRRNRFRFVEQSSQQRPLHGVFKKRDSLVRGGDEVDVPLERPPLCD
jgi:hypothetical protein